MRHTYKLNGKVWTGDDLVFKSVTLTSEDGDTVVVTLDEDSFDWLCPDGNSVERVERKVVFKGKYNQPMTTDGRPMWNNGFSRRRKRRR